MLTAELWCDGANSGPQKQGGWAFVLLSEGGSQLAISGFEAHTTNNRMELESVVRGLQALGEQRAQVTIYVDSAYVKNAFTQGWIKKWQKNGWKSHRGDAVANQDLWAQLIELCQWHAVSWKKVKGHVKAWSFNTLVDQMAVEAKKAGQGTVVLS